MNHAQSKKPRDIKQTIGLILGPVLATLLLFFDLQPGSPEVTRCASVAILMSVWWITKAIPIPATALLPVVLFPLLGVLPGKAVAGQYFNSVIFLFIGGFIIALAMQRWDLHKRIALKIILLIGFSPKRIILGFMAASFFLSMWISNTATTMMIVPMAMAIILKMRESLDAKTVNRFAVGLLISIAYAASIGGTSTLIGTPPNLAFSRIIAISFPEAPEISFAQWMLFALPFALVFFFAAWYIIVRIFVGKKPLFTGDKSIFVDEYRQLGPMKYEERIIFVIFCMTALLWLFRKNIVIGGFTLPGWSVMFPTPGFIDDGTIAIAMGLLLFIIPARKKTEGDHFGIMNWETAMKIQWGIVILFGGGFALAAGFAKSGLAAYLGGQLSGLQQVSPIIIIVVVCTLLTFLTELTSNTATTEIFLPILGALAVAIGVNPLLLMIPATLSASCAFMLPVATPPNAIVFGTGEVNMHDMMRVGIIMNLVGIILITASMYFVGLHVFGIDLTAMPNWAK
ncbi:MAG: SLC13/DASS family transporter [candidate division Zixibacteria bacterium]|nr:SLC13/DASS family transporter [candidate division Zixibacteria bacterium]